MAHAAFLWPFVRGTKSESRNCGIRRHQDGLLQPILSVGAPLHQCHPVVTQPLFSSFWGKRVTLPGLCKGHWTTTTLTAAIDCVPLWPVPGEK